VTLAAHPQIRRPPLAMRWPVIQRRVADQERDARERCGMPDAPRTLAIGVRDKLLICPHQLERGFLLSWSACAARTVLHRRTDARIRRTTVNAQRSRSTRWPASAIRRSSPCAPHADAFRAKAP
jgi:hypothetical protein